MKKFNKVSLVVLVVVSLIIVSVVRQSPVSASIATAPDMGRAEGFSALAHTSMSFTNGGFIQLSGDLGISPGNSSSISAGWTTTNKYYSDTASPDNLVSLNAEADALIAYNNMASQASSGAWNGNATPAPGVWTEDSDTVYNGPLTLDGNYNDVWIFQIDGDFTFSGSITMTGNAQPCNVFFQVTGNANISGAPELTAFYKNFFSPSIAEAIAPNKFIGTLIASDNITFPDGVDVDGRIMSLNGSLIMNGGGSSSFIREPACLANPDPTKLTLIKTVINDNDGHASETDWTLSASGPTNISGRTGSSSVTNAIVNPGTYTLSESKKPSGYTASEYSCVTNDGEAVVGNSITLANGDESICTITNNDNKRHTTTTSGSIPTTSVIPITTTTVVKTTDVVLPPTTSIIIPKFPKTGITGEDNLAIQKATTSETNSPMHLKIPAIKVDAVIESVGLTSDGAMEATKNPQTVGWYNLGILPGETGSSVIAGHSGWKNNMPVVFDNLYKLKKGDKISVLDDKGVTTIFVVSGSYAYNRNDSAKEVFFSSDGKSHLNLITCTGTWNAMAGTHSKRLVIFADKEN